MEEVHLVAISQVDSIEVERLMEKYWKDVWHYAYFFMKSPELADDVAQETFIRAFRNLSSFRGQSSVKTWLLRITHNYAMNYRKTAFFRKVIPFAAPKSGANAASAEVDYFRRQFVDRIWELVLQLNSKHREVLMLTSHYGLSMTEIAAVLGISEGTVKSRLYRARAILTKQLKEDGEDVRV